MDNPYQAPRGEILTLTGGPNPLTWKQILLSFQGRIPRRQYWAGVGIMMLAMIPIAIVAGVAAESENGALSAFAGLVIIVGYIALLWASFAQIKRWHDRDKSGWWVLINFIPLIGAFWALIENGCLRGTEGPNRYGDDPT